MEDKMCVKRRESYRILENRKPLHFPDNVEGQRLHGMGLTAICIEKCGRLGTVAFPAERWPSG